MPSLSQVAYKFTSRVASLLPSGRLLVCVSGGADSTALLRALSILKADIVVAHCNFHLRGEESNRDENFVRVLCESLQVECVVEHFDVAARCEEQGVSVEMACRDLRYDFFRRLAAERGCVRIVVAHNADDNVETLLLNLFRGTGLRGLCAMQPDTGEILRPLLSFSRRDIERFLNDIDAEWIVDSSNLDADYRRNYLRNIMLPQLEKIWPGVRKSLSRSQANLSDALAVYDSAMARLLPDDSSTLSHEILAEAPSRGALLHEFLASYFPSETQIREMAQCYTHGARWKLKGADVVSGRHGFTIIPHSATPDSPDFCCETLSMSDDVWREVLSNRDMSVIYLPPPAERYAFRLRASGDRIMPLGMKGSQLVSDVVKDSRLSPEKRERVWVLTDEESGDIVWVAGLKRSRQALVSRDMSEVLRITLRPRPIF